MMIGLTAFLVLRMWMGKAIEDFNKDITEGNSSAELIAATSNGFTSGVFFRVSTKYRMNSPVSPFSDLGGILVLRCPSHLCSGEAPRYGFREQVITC